VGQQQWNRLCQPRSELTEERADGVDWLSARDAERRGAGKHPLAGLVDVFLIRDQAAVSAYCAKCVAKGGAVELFGLGLTV